MADGNFNFLGIYPKMIDDALETAHIVCSEYGIDENELFGCIADDFEERFDIDARRTHFSNVAAAIVFRNLQDTLRDMGVDDTYYYVNGTLDTHFYIGDEEV